MSKEYRTNPKTGKEEFWCPIDKKWMLVKEHKPPSFEDFFKPLEPIEFDVDDYIENINPDCEHFGSKGIVKDIKKLPEVDSDKVKSKHNTPGKVVVYKVLNTGKTFKPGDMLTKTEIQLKKLDK